MLDARLIFLVFRFHNYDIEWRRWKTKRREKREEGGRDGIKMNF